MDASNDSHRPASAAAAAKSGNPHDAIGGAQEALRSLYANTTDALYWAHACAQPEGHPGVPPQEERDQKLAAALPTLRESVDRLMGAIDALPDYELDKEFVMRGANSPLVIFFHWLATVCSTGRAVIARLSALKTAQAAAGQRLRETLTAAGELAPQSAAPPSTNGAE